MTALRDSRLHSRIVTSVGLLVLCGCPTRFDPRADPVRSSPNADADRDYHEAKARLDVGDNREAELRFGEFLTKHPGDPLAPSARLGQARARLALGQAQKAKEVLEPMVRAQPESDPVAAATQARVRYLLGITLHKTGDFRRSQELLRPFVPQTAGDEQVELHAVLADDAYALGDAEGALSEYGLFFRGARPTERKFLRDRAAELSSKVSPDAAIRLWNESPKDGLVAAYVGLRLSADRRAAGDEAAAQRFLSESRAAREHVGIIEDNPRAPATPLVRAVGCLLPLSGPRRALGERALRGVLLSAGQLTGGTLGDALDVRVRDTASDPSRAAAAVEELTKEGVVALIGSPDRVEASFAAPKAESLGVPFLALAPDETRHGPLSFKLVRPRTEDARAMARTALRSGARTVAVLAPESAYGRSMAQAFVEAAKGAGARVVADLRYAEASTSFIQPVKTLWSLQPDALFVPATAAQLSLIAPQLVGSHLTYMPGDKVPHVARLYATADGLNSGFLQSTAKYLQRAVLAPVFYSGAASGRVTDFVSRYEAAYPGEEPSSLDALAFDAVRAVRVGIERSGDAQSRQAIGAAIARVDETGVTGRLQFGGIGERTGGPTFYVVENDTLRPLQ
jgi:ABC-type branched-subunit amino acid transport system substrate-binding protein